MKPLLRLLCRFHTFLYFLIGQLATRSDNGVHPKHAIMQYHRFFVDNVAPTDSVLDIGCGIGLVAVDMAAKGYKVTGIDSLAQSIEAARKRHAGIKNLTFVIGDATTYPFQEKFDVITLSNVLEHIEKRVEFLIKIRSLAPKFLIRIPMFDRDWLTAYKKELGVEWRLDHTHYTEYTLLSFQEELTAAGYRLESQSIQYGEIWATTRPQENE